LEYAWKLGRKIDYIKKNMEIMSLGQKCYLMKKENEVEANTTTDSPSSSANIERENSGTKQKGKNSKRKTKAMVVTEITKEDEMKASQHEQELLELLAREEKENAHKKTKHRVTKSENHKMF